MAEHPNQLPVAPTNAAYGLAGLGVLGVERVALAVRHGLRHRPQRPECAYGRRSPSDPFERVRRVEVLGLATDRSEGCEGQRFQCMQTCMQMIKKGIKLL